MNASGFRIVILGSGRGSNARALLEAADSDRLGGATIAAVVSDRPDAGILDHARTFGVTAEAWSCAPFKTKLDGDAQDTWIENIRGLVPDLIVLAGFMRVVKPPFIRAFGGRIINLHPSLLPSFPGLDAIGQAWRHGVKVTGCTIHWVTPDVDAGSILDQSAVRIEKTDTLESLEARIHAAEHRLLVSVVARLAQGELPMAEPA
ncbi:MAG: phosphoribosylglycinamide formyltransferase [Opitutales bacterium]